MKKEKILFVDRDLKTLPIEKHDKQLVISLLYRLYFQDYNRACDYNKMTGAEVVEAQHKVLKEIEKDFNITDYDMVP